VESDPGRQADLIVLYSIGHATIVTVSARATPFLGFARLLS
jgi:hypothetical protein